ncbi:hypothetical protein HANVADRAFT_56253 [Hanseniaspora valbyensis NRRL Y-1626]|uniref:Nudix hydrolase domain-containing protein n=1 Tax=Hanseniaspora valbyensis NRRL Y-1626 TaxID=766949 RepID=A0A1B7TDA4_9ASCO|nr:hypothetical protein HANVADRAFT_56253 [Hanseniaspora valbyensis NRRL Y-1626]
MSTYTSKGAPEDSKIISTSDDQPLSSYNWITLQKVNYKDPSGTVRDYEKVTRKTTAKGTGVDAVIILPLLKSPNLPTKLLLQKQFRPPLGKVSIEFPAGLIDDSDATILDAAKRELKEETGYSITKVLRESPPIFADPGMTDASYVVITCIIDLSLKENQNVVPELEDSEFIDLFEVELAELEDKVKQLTKKGYAIDGRVAGLIDGFIVNQQMMMDWKCD